MLLRRINIIFILICIGDFLFAQNITDSTKVLPDNTLSQKKKTFYFDSSFSPRKATIRSAIIPGWGQIYNRQIWKLPLVYGALGTTAGFFIYNLNNYKELKSAYIAKLNGREDEIPERLKPLTANSLKFYRDEFRKNVDYSALFFLIAWGLNVVDASVSAHLRQFDVSDNLSLKIMPKYFSNKQMGLTLALNIKEKRYKNILIK